MEQTEKWPGCEQFLTVCCLYRVPQGVLPTSDTQSNHLVTLFPSVYLCISLKVLASILHIWPIPPSKTDICLKHSVNCSVTGERLKLVPHFHNASGTSRIQTVRNFKIKDLRCFFCAYIFSYHTRVKITIGVYGDQKQVRS